MAQHVRTGRIFGLSILAGLIAGGILTAINLAIVQPSMNLIIEGVIDELVADGEFDEDVFDSQLRSIFLGQTAGWAAAGLAAGAVIGGVVAFGRKKVELSDAILIAGIAWFVLYAVPAAKYPPSPIAMFSEDASAEYYPLNFGYLAVSGLAALGVAAGFRKVAGWNKVLGMGAAYLLAVAVAYFVFPAYTRDSTFDQSLLNSWRALISAATAAFWLSAGGISGLLWKYGLAQEQKKRLE